MNLRDLEYVTAIDRYRNFGRAAHACNVSQPSLSAQVKKLEQSLGVELFARTNAGVHTTDAGTRIVTTAKEMLRFAQRITDTAAEYHDPLAAPLRMGVIPTLAPFALPYLSDSITQIAADLNVIYREQPTDVLWSELEGRVIDVALMSGPVTAPGFRFTPIFREPLVLMVSKKHRLANAAKVVATDILIEELLFLSEEHCLGADTLALCQDKNLGIDMPDQILATNFLTMSHYLSDGVGCSLVPNLSCAILKCANPDMRFIEIEGNIYGRDIGFVSRKGCPREHILMALCDQIRGAPPQGVTALV